MQHGTLAKFLDSESLFFLMQLQVNYHDSEDKTVDGIISENLSSCSREVDSLQQKVCYETSEYFPVSSLCLMQR